MAIRHPWKTRLSPIAAVIFGLAIGLCDAAVAHAQDIWHVDVEGGHGLVGYWKFDESQGTLTRDSVVVTHTSAFSGGTAFSDTLPVSLTMPNFSALALDGVDDEVVVPDEARYNLHTDFSLTAWIHHNNLASNGTLLDSSPVDDGNPWWVFLSSGKLSIGTPAGAILGFGTIPAGEWHHVAVVVRANTALTSTVELYVDGALDRSFAGLQTPGPISGVKKIGRRAPASAGNEQWFKGLIDELRLYNRPLSVEEVKQLAAGRGCATDGLAWSTAIWDLQCALDVAQANDQIWVADGLYRPGTNPDAAYRLVAGAAVYGGFASGETTLEQRDWLANVAVLSGDLDGNDGVDANGIVTNTSNIAGTNAFHVVEAGGVASTTHLDGLTVSAGAARSPASSLSGGGIFAPNGSPTLANMAVVGNSATFEGGGLFASGNATVTISNTVFLNNRADNGGGLYVESPLVLLGSRVTENEAFGFGGGVFAGSTAEIADTLVERNISLADGGGLRVDESLVMSGTKVISNTALSRDGGGLIVSGSAYILNSHFIGNESGELGGGLTSESSDPVRLASVTLVDNRSGVHGGALHASASAFLTDVHFLRNTAGDSGGAIFAATGELFATDSTLTENQAERGGAIYSFGRISLDAVSIIANESELQGGGIFAEGVVVMTGTHVLSNTASGDGGGLIVSGRASILNGSFIGNVSGGVGGGLAVFGSAAITATDFITNAAFNGGGAWIEDNGVISDSRFISNTSTNFGGGLFHDGSRFVNDQGYDLVVTRSEFISNTAGLVAGRGGGLHSAASNLTRLVDTSFVANRAFDGGGVFLRSDTAILSELDVRLNHATRDGGGILKIDGALTMNGSVVSDNRAQHRGGGVNITDSSAVVSMTTFLSNTAVSDGGALFMLDSTLNITDSDLIANRANVGGGVYTLLSVVKGDGNRLLDNNAVNGSGLAHFLSDSTLTGGCIVGNSGTAVAYVSGTAPINTKDNWWGSATGPGGAGPGIGDAVSANVDFTNFRLVPLLDCPTLAPDLTLTKSALPVGPWQPGHIVTYVMEIANAGTVTATQIVMTDVMPDELTALSFSADFPVTQTQFAPEIVWKLQDLPVTASGTITVVAVVTTSLTSDVIVTNTATVTALGEIVISNNLAFATRTVQIPRVQFAGTSFSAVEDGGPTNIVVSLDRPALTPVSVDYAAVGATAAPTDDFTPTAGTLVIPAGQITATFPVSPVADAIVEPDETVALSLGNSAGARLTAPSTATLTLVDDDSATLTLTPINVSQHEGDSGTKDFVFRITLGNAVAGGLSLAVNTADGTATVANGDYFATDVLLAFDGSAGEEKDVTVQVVGDTVVEADESFSLLLGAISGLSEGIDAGALSVSGSPQIAVIENDDEEVGNGDGFNVYLPTVMR